MPAQEALPAPVLEGLAALRRLNSEVPVAPPVARTGAPGDPIAVPDFHAYPKWTLGAVFTADDDPRAELEFRPGVHDAVDPWCKAGRH